MQFVDANSLAMSVVETDHLPDESTYFVFECESHGMFHYGPRTPLTPGLPPTLF